MRGFTKPIIIDDVRLSAKHIVDSLLADPILGEAITAYGKLKFWNTWLHKSISRQILLSLFSGIPLWWSGLVGDHHDAATLFAMRNRAIFDGLLAYVLKLITAAEQQLERSDAIAAGNGSQIDVFLIGQGWDLLHLQVSQGEYEPRLYVQRRLKELQATLPFVEPHCTFEIHVPPDPKPVTSFGVAMLPAVRSASELNGNTGIRTILGLDITFHDGSALGANEFLGARQNHPLIAGAVTKNGAWDQFVGPLLRAPGITDHVRQLFGKSDMERQKYVESRISYLVSIHIREALAKGLMPRISPLNLLLEHVWVEELPRLRHP
jgi:hypothetical protein